MSNYLVIYAHPYEGSFNHAIYRTVVANLRDAGHDVSTIDLYREGFDPVYDKEELRLFHTGETHDPLVTRYLRMLRHADAVIFITPIWWNYVPGMLKGFLDKVMKEGEGLSHTVSKTGIHGELTNINRAWVLTTSTSPTLYLRLVAGDGIRRVFLESLKQLGMSHRRWINFGGVSGSSQSRRERHLSRLRSMTF